jgi:hypothetical protein
MTPESWREHAASALRRERYVVRNAGGEPVRGGLLPADGIIVTQPDETLELLPGPSDPDDIDDAGRHGLRLRAVAGFLAGVAAGFAMTLAAAYILARI